VPAELKPQEVKLNPRISPAIWNEASTSIFRVPECQGCKALRISWPVSITGLTARPGGPA
jgi:hypothetical protein